MPGLSGFLGLLGGRAAAWTPAARTDLVLWPKVATGKVYTDTGGTTPAAVGDPVRAIRDSATGGLHTLASGASAVNLSQDPAGRLYLPCRGATWFDLPTFSVGSRSLTAYAYAVLRSKINYSVTWGLGSAALNIFGEYAKLSVYDGGIRSSGGDVRFREFPDWTVVSSAAGGLTLATPDVSGTISATGSSTITTGQLLAAGGGSAMYGDFYEGLLVATADDATARQQVFDYHPRAAYTRPKLCVCVGDSRTFGQMAAITANDYPTRLAASLGATWDVCNLGFGGVASATFPTAAADGLYSATRTKNVLVVWGGTNTDWTDYTTFRAYVQARIAAGWSVVVCTDLYGTGKTSANRASYNASILANTGDGYTVADLAATSGIGADGDITGPNFSDQLHLNDTGFGVAEPVIRAAVLAV